MKKLILLIIIIGFVSSKPLPSYKEFESEYCKGYKKCYGEGYCYNKGQGCVKPIAPPCPIPQLNEKSTSYTDGCNRGFTDGKKKQ